MDEIDRQLIMDLETKGFQKSSALAHLYGLSERTIRRRVNTLISSELIKVIVAPNFVLLGFEAWGRIGIKVEPGSISRVARVLVCHPAIHFVAYTLGGFDIIISVYFDTIEKLTQFVNSELSKVEGILSTETILLVQPRRYMLFSWPAPSFRSSKNKFESHYNPKVIHTKYKLDEVDQSILNILMEDGPIRPKILASRLGIGENTIRKHLKTIALDEVYKIEIVPNVDVVEYHTQAQTLINISSHAPHKIIDSILEHSAVYLASACLGRFNLVIATRFRNPDLLEQFVTKFLPSIPGISSTETCLHVKRLKYYNTTWPIDLHPQRIPPFKLELPAF